ncbi:RNA polymerase sigma factor [Nonomuraea sp. NPDC050663]|uniref:RNA polymerase sigma factor n=1 Tax=Nonomuraea sp. NPDC050663 TaxID=3364370 RepID=UPI0037AD6018
MASLPADTEIVAALRAGDEVMFAALVDAWSRNLLWLARSYVSTDASAQEVLQDTWLGVLRGLDGFQGRSSFKTWVHRILINTAKRRGVRESRTVPWSSIDGGEPAVDPGRFRLGHWREPPAAWPSAEGEALVREAGEQLARALATLPPRQRAVIVLRDAEGYSADEVCELLGITAVNQRVLLHRARAALRNRVERYFLTMAGRT